MYEIEIEKSFHIKIRIRTNEKWTTKLIKREYKAKTSIEMWKSLLSDFLLSNQQFPHFPHFSSKWVFFTFFSSLNVEFVKEYLSLSLKDYEKKFFISSRSQSYLIQRIFKEFAYVWKRFIHSLQSSLNSFVIKGKKDLKFVLFFFHTHVVVFSKYLGEEISNIHHAVKTFKNNKKKKKNSRKWKSQRIPGFKLF